MSYRLPTEVARIVVSVLFLTANLLFAVNLFSTRGVINRRGSIDSVHDWLLAVASQGEKEIGSRKNVLKLERNVLLFSRPLCRANSNRRQNGRGYPVLRHVQHFRRNAYLCIQTSNQFKVTERYY